MNLRKGTHISLVIPTWNEERWLPRLLKSALKLNCCSEIIVADNDSSDNTKSIAAKSGCRIVSGGRPARARNSGAAASLGSWILFCDADTILADNVIERLYLHMQRPNVVGIHFRIEPISATRFVNVCYKVMYLYLRLLASVNLVQGVGSFIAVRKDAFVKAGGFNEKISVGEDADFLRRLGKIGVIAFDRKATVFVSARRFSLENPFYFAAKTVFWAVLRLFGSSRSVLGYKWQTYPAEFAIQEQEALGDLSETEPSLAMIPSIPGT